MSNNNHYILEYNKVKVDDTIYWDLHRGGWKYVVDILKYEVHAEDGILFINALEDHLFHRKPLEQPWIAFIHQVPDNNNMVFPDLKRLINYNSWKRSIKYCKGIYTLSSYLKDFLDAQNLPVKVNRLFYPMDFDFVEFDKDGFLEGERKIIFIGEYLRNFQPFFDIKADGYKKILLDNEAFRQQDVNINESVEIVARVSDEEYDSLLSTSIVFLNLYDAPANTTVLECIARNAPILINRLPGVIEYLGEDYPLYYNSVEEAGDKLKKLDLVMEAHQYLVSMDKQKITKEFFVKSLHASPIYRSLDIPNSQKDKIFKQYDITVVITSYNRVYNIRGILERFSNQEFDGTFEVILWNNNISTMAELDLIVEDFKDKINIRLIHSSENYYCAMRLAMAHLMQSDYLLICDDDVQPGKHYIRDFWQKYQAYGPEAVLCTRGHKFEPHTLDEETADKVWDRGKHMTFYDETKEDIQIHFFHADNCLIPRSILLKLNNYEWENLDFILIDDYWMSYIISHELRIPIWKVKFDDNFKFTPCADNKDIALFHNPKVRKERATFYKYHMRKGWPASVIENDHENETPVAPTKSNETDEADVMLSRESIHFKDFDISIIMCVYSRLFNIREILDCFSKQSTQRSFELVIWNNNFEFRNDLNEIAAIYRDKLDIKLIHSSENILCRPRLALSSLVRGEKVVFCDDDVLPGITYLEELWENHERYGDKSLVCVSGESFLSNELDEDNPHLIWKKDNIRWHTYDEPTCEVHYFHANSCILSKQLLKQAATYSYPQPEMAWIDDYWLSYLLSHVLGVELRKIKGDAFLSFTNDNDKNDSEIALSRNPNIKYHKVAFYLYHYDRNWRPVLGEEVCEPE
ncbi:glycosyltransferase [Fulvivirga sp. 29W222]|uniref:Glycosyltransferase n=1 Tax=Fulvivirga marina TaxID=2494733 RepID=A0A937FTP6_9BACT|nr:glycosyltransferase [Fulvivirga marina]MBL6445765.1 glycosyltransferase [Fulvivirga marina]